MNRGFSDTSLLRDKKGFTLLEVLIAICLLAVGMMGLVSLQSRGIRSNDLGNRTTQAVALAQDKLEDLIDQCTRTATKTLTPGASSDGGRIDETGAINADGMFSRTWAISPVGSPVGDAQQVDVSVRWADIIGPHNVNVSGVITSDAY